MQEVWIYMGPQIIISYAALLSAQADQKGRCFHMNPLSLPFEKNHSS